MDKEKLNYGVECKDIDFGLLTARNQLIKRVISPLHAYSVKARTY